MSVVHCTCFKTKLQAINDARLGQVRTWYGRNNLPNLQAICQRKSLSAFVLSDLIIDCYI